MDAATYKARIGARLRQAIEAQGLRQADVARQLGVSRSKLAHWLAGRWYPDPLFVLDFCEQYNISLEWVYRGRVSLGRATRLVAALLAEDQASSQVPWEPGLRSNETGEGAAQSLITSGSAGSG